MTQDHERALCEHGARPILRRHVALAWIIVSVVGVFVFSYAINLN